MSRGRWLVCCGAPPAAGTLHNCVESDLSDRKYSVLASGDQRGLLPTMIFCGCASGLFKCNTHTLVMPLLAAKSVSRTVKAAAELSADNCGSPTRSIVTRSWALKGWGVAVTHAGNMDSNSVRAANVSFMA